MSRTSSAMDESEIDGFTDMIELVNVHKSKDQIRSEAGASLLTYLQSLGEL